MPNGSMRVCGAPGPISGPRRRSGGSKPMAGRVRCAISSGIGWLASPVPRRRTSCYGTSWIWGRESFESVGCQAGGCRRSLCCIPMPHREWSRHSVDRGIIERELHCRGRSHPLKPPCHTHGRAFPSQGSHRTRPHMVGCPAEIHSAIMVEPAHRDPLSPDSPGTPRWSPGTWPSPPEIRRPCCMAYPVRGGPPRERCTGMRRRGTGPG
jgi:hypothetical protein